MLLEPVDPNEKFRQRRRQARKRRAIRRTGLLAVVALTAAGVTLGARSLTIQDQERPAASSRGGSEPTPTEPKPEPRPYPAEMRGVHVTMALASVEGKLEEYLDLTRRGLNTVELDIKDENGEVGFANPAVPLAREVGAVRRYYNPRRAATAVHAKGVYLIGRIVCFEDPILSEGKPSFAIRTPGGDVWRNAAGLGWTNPYDKRVWKYNVDLAVAAAEAGFDEIQFDYVRFPTDGDVSSAVYDPRTQENKAKVIAAFLEYASGRLRPLGVRVSADLFGLAATRNMGIGQKPSLLARHVDALYPMVYPSHFGPGELGVPDPNAQPGRTVALALRDFDVAMRGSGARLVPWLQDFSLGRSYTAQDVRDQIQAARDAGAEGFMLWNAGGVYTASALAGA
jgi:hypothetical protein